MPYPAIIDGNVLSPLGFGIFVIQRAVSISQRRLILFFEVVRDGFLRMP